MYLAVVEIHHCAAAINVEPSALPTKEGKCHGNVFQCSFREGSERERLHRTAQARYPIGKVRERSSNGVMDKDSWKVQKASTHASLHERDTIGKVREFHPTG